jgi:hypothetical protein
MPRFRATLLSAVVAALAIGAIAALPAMGAAAEPEPGPEAPAEVVAPESAEVTPAAAGEGCVSGNVCVWSESGYQGIKKEYRCTFGNHEPGTFAIASAKNRCPNRPARLLRPGADSTCLNPNGNRPAPPLAQSIFVYNQGERC